MFLRKKFNQKVKLGKTRIKDFVLKGRNQIGAMR